MSTSLIAFLIFVGIFLLILLGCLFLASREKTHGNPYGSWSSIMGPQWNSRALDVGGTTQQRHRHRSPPGAPCRTARISYLTHAP